MRETAAKCINPECDGGVVRGHYRFMRVCPACDGTGVKPIRRNSPIVCVDPAHESIVCVTVPLGRWQPKPIAKKPDQLLMSNSLRKLSGICNEYLTI